MTTWSRPPFDVARMISPLCVSTASSASPQAATDTKPHKSKQPVLIDLIVSPSVVRTPRCARTVAQIAEWSVTFVTQMCRLPRSALQRAREVEPGEDAVLEAGHRANPVAGQRDGDQ